MPRQEAAATRREDKCRASGCFQQRGNRTGGGTPEPHALRPFPGSQKQTTTTYLRRSPATAGQRESQGRAPRLKDSHPEGEWLSVSTVDNKGGLLC
jgi:hypothetical protein